GGGHLAVASNDGEVEVHEVASPGGLPTVLRGHKGRVNWVAFRPDGKHLATASEDGTARLWDLSTSQEIRALPHESAVLCVTFSRNGELVASSDTDGEVKMWDAATGK